MKSVKIDKNKEVKLIEKLLQKGVYNGVFPGGAAAISHGSGKQRKTSIGMYGKAALYPEERKLKNNTCFDLASLTKPLATTMAVLCLLKEKKIGLNEKVEKFFSRIEGEEKKSITVEQLLGHSSGLPAHRDYFRVLQEVAENRRVETVEKLIFDERLEYTPGSKAVYSDLGFIILGSIIEIISGCCLDDFVEENILTPINLGGKIFYNRLSGSSRNLSEKEFAATENCPWRKKTLCGEVHDDNCYALGGVAGHSGLFGDIESATRLVSSIHDMWKGASIHPNIENSDLTEFLVKQKVRGSSRTLGFDTPSGEEPSCGSFFSENSVGHLGFSGTSFWIDPEKDVAVVLLTNRIHPNRKNTGIKKYRPFFHDSLIKTLFAS